MSASDKSAVASPKRAKVTDPTMPMPRSGSPASGDFSITLSGSFQYGVISFCTIEPAYLQNGD
jgi:hypothetical protein